VRRGVALSGAALAATLASDAISAAPTGLAASVSAVALSSAAASGGVAFSLLQLMATTKLKITVGAVLVTGVGATLVLERQAQARLRNQNNALRQQVEQSAQLSEENQRLTNLLARSNANSSAAQNQLPELLRLRGEVGALRQQKGELDNLRAENRELRSRPSGQAARPLTPAERWPNVIRELPKESWTFAGYADPEAALQSLFWAGTSGDAQKILDSVVPEFAQEAKTEAGPKRLAAVTTQIGGNMGRWKNVRILEKQTPSDDEVHFVVNVVYNEGMDTIFKMKLKRIGSEWKYYGEADAD
jgi:hypothetical protein